MSYVSRLDELKEIIEEKIALSGDSSFAVFDFDNTCIVNDIGEAAFHFLCRNDLFKSRHLQTADKYRGYEYNKRVFLQYYDLLAQGKITEAYVFLAEAFAGSTPEEALAMATATIEAEGKHTGTQELYGVSIAQGLAERPEVLEIINFLEARRVAIWIVSASPQFAVQAAASYFHIPGKIIGLRNRIEDGAFSAELERPLSIGQDKVACIKAFINPNAVPILGAGDSMNDLPMLELAEIKIVVGRGNGLTKIAIARDWVILSGK
jgi:phosphoserine phosphatase